MGDEGRLYVKPEMVEAFKAEIVPLATIIVRKYRQSTQTRFHCITIF